MTVPLPSDFASTSRPASPGFSINQDRRTPPPSTREATARPFRHPGADTTGETRGNRGAWLAMGHSPGPVLEGKTHAINERKGPLMDVGRGPPRIQGLLGHPDDVGGAWNALTFAVQTGTQGRPGSRDSSPRHARGPVPTNLIGRLRGEAPPRCTLPEQADHRLEYRTVATTPGRRGPRVDLEGGA